MVTTEVTETQHLGTEQCGNQTAYGLPGCRYCANYKAPGQEWCRACCKDIRDNYPGTDTSRRKMPVEMLTYFDPAGKVFVWPSRGQESEEQRGQIFVFDHLSFWAKQMGHGPMSLREDGSDVREHWADMIEVYLQDTFRRASGDLYGFSYTMESLQEIASIYGQPVAAQG